MYKLVEGTLLTTSQIIEACSAIKSTIFKLVGSPFTEGAQW